MSDDAGGKRLHPDRGIHSLAPSRKVRKSGVSYRSPDLCSKCSWSAACFTPGPEIAPDGSEFRVTRIGQIHVLPRNFIERIKLMGVKELVDRPDECPRRQSV